MFLLADTGTIYHIARKMKSQDERGRFQLRKGLPCLQALLDVDHRVKAQKPLNMKFDIVI